jgi:transposase-like protein
LTELSVLEDGLVPCHTAVMEKHKCPHCDAVYEVTYTKIAFRDRDSEDCAVCGKQMASWNGSSIPSYRLIETPERPAEAG